MPLLPVDAPTDPRLAAYTAIREKDLTTGHGARFIIEGRVTLETAIRRGRFALESVFLAENRLGPLSDILSLLPSDIPVYVAPQTVMDEITGFPMHRGVLACGLKRDIPAPLQFLASPAQGARRSTLLLLSDISNHDNVGACFRNAAAFGADAVLMDGQCCDPLYRKAIRVSSGASLWLPYAQGGTGLDMVNAVKTAGYQVWALTPRAEARPLTIQPVPDRLAILLGAEGPGLPEGVIAACTPVQIAMSEGFDSVNVATAGAIAMSHIFSSRNWKTR